MPLFLLNFISVSGNTHITFINSNSHRKVHKRRSHALELPHYGFQIVSMEKINAQSYIFQSVSGIEAFRECI